MFLESNSYKIIKSIYALIFLLATLIAVMLNQVSPQQLQVMTIKQTGDVKVNLRQYPKVSIKHNNIYYHSSCFSDFINLDGNLCKDSLINKNLKGENIKLIIIRKKEKKTYESIILEGLFFDDQNSYNIILPQNQIDYAISFDYKSMVIFRLLIISIFCVLIIQIVRFSKSDY